MKQRNFAGIMFASPWLVGFVLLVAWPFAASIYWSFCYFDLINPPQPAGTAQYERLISELREGRGFAVALQNTAYYAMLSVPLSIVVGLGLAIMLSWKIRGQAFYRTVFYLPAVIPIVAASILWLWLLDPQDGMVNYMLGWIGLNEQNWLTQSRSAVSGAGVSTFVGWVQGNNELTLFGSKDALVLMSVWAVGNAMIIFLAALGDVPESLYEAATIDGAGRWRKFWHITLPMMSPIIFFNLVMGLIRAVQTFTSIYILSEGTGQPGDSLLVFSLHLFLSAFADLEMGYASAMAWVMFVLLVICTWLLFRSSRHWVFYQSQ
ncbi:MAG: carbohydrate ABC transporter permease [Pirellulaceae bacterium]